MIKKLKDFWQSEKSISALIPFSSVVAPGVVIGRNGELMATLHLEGITFETQSQEALEIACRQLNNFYCTVAKNNRIIQVHRVRRPITEQLTAPEAGIAREFALKYNRRMGQTTLFTTELYLTLIERASVEPHKRKFSDFKEEFEERMIMFEALLESLQSNFAMYRPTRLSEYEENGVLYSDLLSFYNFLITGSWQKIRLPEGPLFEALGNTRVFVGGDTLQFQGAFGNTFAQSIEFLD